MVRNQTLTSAVSAELTGSLQQTLTEGRLRRLEQQIGLPTTFAGFLVLALAVALVCGGMALLVVTSVQTYQARQQLASLERTYQAIERQNAELVWQIAQHTNLEQVRQRALALGYQPPAERHFAPWPSTALAVQSPAEPSVALSHLDGAASADADLWSWAIDQLNRIRTWW
jgi:cell division protein FtsL